MEEGIGPFLSKGRKHKAIGTIAETSGRVMQTKGGPMQRGGAGRPPTERAQGGVSETFCRGNEHWEWGGGGRSRWAHVIHAKASRRLGQKGVKKRQS